MKWELSAPKLYVVTTSSSILPQRYPHFHSTPHTFIQASSSPWQSPDLQSTHASPPTTNTATSLLKESSVFAACPVILGDRLSCLIREPLLSGNSSPQGPLTEYVKFHSF